MTDAMERLSTALADRYRMERELGAGGMATVYLAEDLKHHRRVALKVLRPELAAAIGPERFLREIETTAGLHHPHILALYDSGEAAGFLYYVMPYVEGESLRDRLDRERQLPLDDALQIAREVADALSYAHSRGVIHRDIKPENILLESRHALVADFGIAKAVSAAGGETLTQTGVAVGTPRYMSPEQAAGERELDGRSDLYALGCVLYEMLAGQPPFTGPTVESVVHQHLTAEPRAITQLRPAVPAVVAGVLQRALAKNPADRFNPVAQFSDALHPGPAGVAPGRPPRRWPRAVVLAAAATIVLLAGAWFAGRTWLGRSGHGAAIERIAVLPLENATGDSTRAFFADGMTRELIGVLTTAGVRVLGHRAVAAYRGTSAPAHEIARELDVDALVAGSVLQGGEVVQVAMELIDPTSGESLWAATVSKPAIDVVTLQRELAAEIADGIRARLTPEQRAGLATARRVDPDAYAQYLLGQEQLLRWTDEGFRRGVEHLIRSLARDSLFSPAWAMLATGYSWALFYGWVPGAEARGAIDRAATRALALDARQGDQHIARGMAHLFVDWDFGAAEREFRRGATFSLSAAAWDQYAMFFWEMGRFDEAMGAIRKAIDLEPTTAQWHSDLGWFLQSAGDTAGQRVATMRAIALDPTFFEAHDQLGEIELACGNLAAARAELERAKALAGGDYAWSPALEGRLLVAERRIPEARALLARLDRDPANRRYALQALVHLALGERDSTYVMLERGIAAREPEAILILTATPALYPLHGEPRYRQLRRRAGIPG